MTVKSCLTLILAVAVTPALEATISFNIYRSGLADELAVPTNGMYVGIVVDTAQNGFEVGQYSAFDLNLSGQFLPTNTGATDDYYYFQPVSNDPRPVTVDFAGSSGGIVTFWNMPMEVPLATEDPFALVWFADNTATAGSYYGFLSREHWTLPPDGGAFSEQSVIIETLAAQYAIVPEPSVYALAFGGLALGVVMWRRRGNR